MADPNQPMSLKQAITPVGTCTSMCPEFERVERIVQKMVDKNEKVHTCYKQKYLVVVACLSSIAVSAPFNEFSPEHGNEDAKAVQKICCWL
jgi:hypothetical protein